jgi:hypothetical protein
MPGSPFDGWTLESQKLLPEFAICGATQNIREPDPSIRPMFPATASFCYACSPDELWTNRMAEEFRSRRVNAQP